MTTKQIISKSFKRKMSSGNRVKANAYTQMVVYKTSIGNGKFTSETRHELLPRN